MKPIAIGDILLVEWEDAMSQLRAAILPCDKPSALRYTIGVVAATSPGRVVLVHEWSETQGEIDKDDADSTVIPRALIRQVMVLG